MIVSASSDLEVGKRYRLIKLADHDGHRGASYASEWAYFEYLGLGDVRFDGDGDIVTCLAYGFEAEE